jgi:hypothetical protein
MWTMVVAGSCPFSTPIWRGKKELWKVKLFPSPFTAVLAVYNRTWVDWSGGVPETCASCVCGVAIFWTLSPLPLWSQEELGEKTTKAKNHSPALDSPDVLSTLCGESHVAARSQSRCILLLELRCLTDLLFKNCLQMSLEVWMVPRRTASRQDVQQQLQRWQEQSNVNQSGTLKRDSPVLS